MAVKAINDTAGPDSLVLMLFIFNTYPQINKLNLLIPSITQQAVTIKKAMEEIAKIKIKKQVNNTLNQQNGLSVTMIYDLPLNLNVLI
jgi:hypothetical protein